jgi:hypothetical protein
MEDQIYKYPLSLYDDTPLSLPLGAAAVFVDVQQNQVCLWVRLPVAYPDSLASPPPVRRVFRVVGTGHRFPSTATSVGSCQLGPLVLHVIELAQVAQGWDFAAGQP